MPAPVKAPQTPKTSTKPTKNRILPPATSAKPPSGEEIPTPKSELEVDESGGDLSEGETEVIEEDTLDHDDGGSDVVEPDGTFDLDEREDVYPEVKAGVKTLTQKIAKDALGWEDEDTYKERVKTEGKGKAGKGIGFGEDFLLRDEYKKKVRCWNNTRNRPFTESWARALAQDIILSGPKIPEKKRRWKLNGEAVIIGKKGQVLSAQHRLIGLVLACQMWAKNPDKWLKYWPTEPTIDSVVVTGIDEDQSTTRTLDNVKPRTLSDVFFTSDLFRKMSEFDRKECARYLANAVDLAWVRTGVKKVYQTHGESCDFLDRHKKLLECVHCMFGDNKDRAISTLNLSAGSCAALMYLMATSTTDTEEYASVRNEKAIDFSTWDKAREFWIALGTGVKSVEEVRSAIGRLIDPEEEGSGRRIEKNSVLVKAWLRFIDKLPIRPEDLELSYDEGKLVDPPVIGGIDFGEGKNLDPSPEEIGRQKEELKKARMAEMEAKVKAGKQGGKKK